MQDIKDRTALVTGAASGIGLCLVEALAQAGARIVAADIDSDELNRTMGPFGSSVLPVKLDVTDRAGWQGAKEIGEAHFSPIDILINNAGIATDGRMLCDMDPAAFDQTISINLTGAFNGISTFAGDMKARGVGHILNTASHAGLFTHPRMGAYSASKFAVVGMSEALQQEMQPFGVGVSVLCPGLVRTRLAQTTVAAGLDRSNMSPTTFETGLDPRRVAQLALAAIRENRFYVMTHGELRSEIAARNQALLDAFEGVAPSNICSVE
jgi:NAD(P)-dependent dehydrogenase (short-subunit alcohol dehydrogenase family)